MFLFAVYAISKFLSTLLKEYEKKWGRMTQNKHFHDDRPISKNKEDRLGYAHPAQRIAEAILNLSSPEGFVLGLEGEWGSGKTSFVNLITESLEGRSNAPKIVKFSPWLISTRSALLGELFQSIATAALEIPLTESSEASRKKGLKNWSWLNRDAKKRELSNAINKFGSHISKLGQFAEVAETLGIPYANTVGRTLSKSGDAISKKSSPTLDKEKENLQSELRKLSQKIIVFVDDLDRLEPNEAIEIVRLVRAVVDFPNIVYVLCYSRKILVPSLAQALYLSDGEKYLDKIVQVTFSVPKPESFDLRRMFKQKIEELFPEYLQVKSEDPSDQMLQRLNQVIDFEGGRTLSTPRDVARALNSLQLYAAPVINKIDLADMTWLQLIRIRSYKLYEWIEEYMNTASVLVSGATISGHGIKKTREDLFAIIEEERADKEAVMRIFCEMLPGIDDGYIERDGQDRWKFFHELTKDKAAGFIQDNRLGSPQHFRYYFALAKPSSAIEDSDFQEFLEKAKNNVNDAIEHFSSLSSSTRPQGGVWAEAVIDRLVNVGIEKVPVESISGIILSLSFTMDKIALHKGIGDWGQYWIWSTAKSIMRTGLKRISTPERSDTLNRAFSEGGALGWLTSLLRDETFAHGLVGNKQANESERLLTTDEFAIISETMRNRYKNTAPATLMETPQFTNVLFGWMQLGKGGEAEREVKAWVRSTSATDEGFVALMENMRSWTSVNGQVIFPLKAQNIEHFCDVDEVDNRLARISEQEDGNLSLRAKALVQAREISRDF